ncbi:MAG TPA: DUF2264 domain-containing protein [Candidatus Limnocylindrales bacterium]|nr:DUF2264 domain-containing protein [Candidatus Limnocylindrales bacterium]
MLQQLTRPELVALADRMLAAVRPFASPGHARITLPGAEGGYGRAVDGLEGFARTFLLAGFRIAGDPHSPASRQLAEWYAQGIANGGDPSAPDRWVRLPEHGQAKVEAASIALILDLTRPWIWDRLDPETQGRVVEYLSPAVGDETYPQINWVWFRLVVQTFLRSVGGPHSLAEMKADLATHDSFARGGGWMSDGPSRAFDHYVGWALHLYPALWARMTGAQDLKEERAERDRVALDEFLRDLVTLVGADGSPLLQGRSLIYRFAAAAPFWVGALAGVDSVPLGQLRRAATATIGHFVERGAPDADGLLTMGWHGEWRRLAQSYSGPGSPYWAAKGMLGLMLPADHPLWTAPEVLLPIEERDTLSALPAPGWLVSATRADGIVRIVNHGTDHAHEGSTLADSPFYARLGYSTATCPVLDDSGWSDPVDQSVVLVDAEGRTTHRAGMRTLAVQVMDGVGVAASTSDAHWVRVERGQMDYGEGRRGEPVPAGRVTIVSLVRGPWEVRLSRVDSLAEGVDPDSVRLRVGGWPIAGETTVSAAEESVTVTGPDGLRSVVTGALSHGTKEKAEAGPLGPEVTVPYLEDEVHVGAWITTILELSRGETRPACRVLLEAERGVRVDWPDGTRTFTPLETIIRSNG